LLDVHTTSQSFNPTAGESIAVAFTLEAPAAVQLRVYDGRDVLVYQSEVTDFAEGESVLTWDGRDTEREIVPNEAYSYVLIGSNADGEAVHDLTDLTGGEALLVPDARWDASAGQLNFSLDHPARISVRFGIENGPFLRTLTNWVPRAAGLQSIAWDGWDASGVLSLADHPRLQPTVRAYTLPANTIFVGAWPMASEFARVDTSIRRPSKPKPPKTRMFFHADQPLESRGDVPVDLELVGAELADDAGAIAVSGIVPVRLDVPSQVKGLVLARRFEPAFFVDGTFVHETEVGFLPLTWQWDTTTLNPGEHYLTVNLRGYEGNFGAATIKVLVSHPPVGRAADVTTPSAESGTVAP
jgi:hypothetical protein